MPDVILVDGSDRETGTAGVLEAHSGQGMLHRAFTIFIFNPRREVLVQKRSAGKRLWPQTWETSCSGHPVPGEDMTAAAEKRLRQELGFGTGLKTVGKFTYRVPFQDAGIEHELCHVLVGEHDGEVRPDPAEVQEYRWTGVSRLHGDIAARGDEFAPWLSPALEVLEGT
jgi:isopentenyl-diphosphate delta-isomerase